MATTAASRRLVGMWHVLLVVALVGCSSPADLTGAELGDVPLLVPPPTYRGQDRVLPLLLQISGEDEVSRPAVQNLVAKCMRDHGFAYFALDSTSSTDKVVNTDDPEWRARHGYGVADSLAVAPLPPDRNAEYRTTLTPDELNAYGLAFAGPDNVMVPVTNSSGVEIATYSNQGCMVAGMVEYLGYDNGAMMVFIDEIERVRNESILAMRADRRWVAVWADWSRCMDTHGWQFETRGALIEFVVTSASEPEAAATLERTIAEVDNLCSEALDTDEQLWSLQYSYDEIVLSTISPLLAEIRAKSSGKCCAANTAG